MNRENEQRDEDLIDLGSVSSETKGLGGVAHDHIGQQGSTGLSDE